MPPKKKSRLDVSQLTLSLAVIVTWVKEGTAGISKYNKGHMKGCKWCSALQLENYRLRLKKKNWFSQFKLKTAVFITIMKTTCI